jgi:5-methylcytosine-specific restriction enzyme A
MPTYLLTWNPKKWHWETLEDDLDTFRTEGVWVTSWSCGNRKAIFPEDRVFLIKQGPRKPRGIFASGYVTHGPKTARHFTDRSKQARYIDIEFNVLLDPQADVLARERLDRPPFSSVNWGTQSGGIAISPDVADRLERIASARAACINAKGVRCLCCRVDFSERYGDLGQGFIYVHHQDTLAASGRRKTNPVEDLFPVCPNCHAMLHRSNPQMEIDELRRLIRT